MTNKKLEQLIMRLEHTMDIILLILGISVFMFTLTMIIIFCVFQSVPDSLVSGFYGLVGSEGGFMAVIKVAKEIVENRYEKLKEADVQRKEDCTELGLESRELDERTCG